MQSHVACCTILTKVFNHIFFGLSLARLPLTCNRARTVYVRESVISPFVYPFTYLRNHTAQLHQIFVRVARPLSGSVEIGYEFRLSG